MNCLFCGNNIQNVIYQTENFYVKIGKGIITAGHVMIIPKKHYLAIADIDKSIVNEYNDLKFRLIEEVTKNFAKPFLIEHGIFAQSVFHGHIHIIPSSGNGYDNFDIMNEMVNPAIKKYNIKFEIISDFDELVKIYKKDGEYLYFEFNDAKYVLRTKNSKKEDFDENDIAYRSFFTTKKKLVGIGDWKTMSEEDIARDNKKIEDTKNKIIL